MRSMHQVCLFLIRMNIMQVIDSTFTHKIDFNKILKLIQKSNMTLEWNNFFSTTWCISQ